MAAPQKLGSLGEGKRSDGAVETRQMVRALNKVYNDTITVGTNIHNFNLDFGYNSVQGWIVNDGAGQFSVAFTRDGAIYGEDWTMLPGERLDLNGFDVHSLRITFVAIAADYRVWLI